MTAPKLFWRRKHGYGWTARGEEHQWTVRGPIMGRRMFWLYHWSVRWSPTGRSEDSVSFPTAAAAKAAAQEIEDTGLLSEARS